MKTEEELNALKEEVEALNRKLAELTDEELEQITGGVTIDQKAKLRICIREDGRTVGSGVAAELK